MECAPRPLHSAVVAGDRKSGVRLLAVSLSLASSLCVQDLSSGLVSRANGSAGLPAIPAICAKGVAVEAWLRVSGGQRLVNWGRSLIKSVCWTAVQVLPDCESLQRQSGLKRR